MGRAAFVDICKNCGMVKQAISTGNECTCNEIYLISLILRGKEIDMLETYTIKRGPCWYIPLEKLDEFLFEIKL